MPTIPTSQDFDLLDWSTTPFGDVTDGILLHDPEVTRVGNFISSDGTEVRFISNDDKPSDLSFTTSIPKAYTFEFALTLSSVPEDFGSGAHVFVGAVDAQQYTSGLLFSKEGVAIVSNPDEPAKVLPGSSGLIIDAEITVRIVTRTDGTTADLYVTPTSMLEDTGHVLRYTTSVAITSSTTGDAILFAMKGNPSNQVDVSVKNVRLSTKRLIPNQRPIAVIDGPKTVVVGQAAVLSGVDSYDPEELPLTYSWKILQQPKGSDVLLEGRTEASAAFGTKSLIADEQTGNSFDIIAVAAGSSGIGRTVDLVYPLSADAESDIVSAYDEDTDTVTITLRWTSEDPDTGKTKPTELAAALNEPSNSAYNSEVSALVRVVPDGDLEVETFVSAGSAELAGGSDSTKEQTLFFPQLPGTYTLQLVVSDGELESLPQKLILTALESSAAVGYVPDANFVWNYLSDFWNVHEEKALVSSVWSGAIQSIAADLLRGWTKDYNRSIDTIPESAVHKWVGYPTRIAVDVRSTHPGKSNPVEGSFRSSTSITATRNFWVQDTILTEYALVLHAEGTSISRVVSSSPFRGLCRSTPDGTKVVAVDEVPPATAAGDLLKIGTDAYKVVSIGSGSLTVDTVVPASAQVDSQVGGALLLEDSVPTHKLVDSGRRVGMAVDDGDGDGTTPSLTTTHGLFTTQAGDVLLLEDEATPSTYTVSSVSNDKTTLTVSPEIPSDIRYVSWAVWRAYSPKVEISSIPAITMQRGPEYSIKTGDILINKENGSLAVVVGTNGLVLGLTHQVGFSVEVMTPASVPIPASVTSIPRLTKSGGSPSFLAEFVDYEIATYGTEKRIEFLTRASDGSLDWDTLTSASTDFTGTEGQYVYIHIGPFLTWGYYRIEEVISATEVRLPTTQETVVSDLTFTLLPHAVPSPANYWAEFTYVDNNETIENNFGLLVGLKKDDITSNYKNSVRALWFVLWSGPTLSNIRLGTQAFFSVPFSERRGVVIGIDSQNDTHGFIRVQDLDEKRVVRSYRYVKSVGLETNPATDAAYKVGDVVEQFAPLVKGVKVSDYVKDSTWDTNTPLTGVKRIHTFRVEVDLEGVDDETKFDLVRTYVEKIKPAHTDFTLVGYKGESDTISVVDEYVQKGYVQTQDNPYVTGDAALPFQGGARHRIDDFDGSGSWYRLDSSSGEMRSPYGGELPTELSDTWFPYAYIDSHRSRIWIELATESGKDFEIGELVEGGTTGHRGRIIYRGPQYLIVRELHETGPLAPVNPYEAFSVGEDIVGQDSGIIVVAGTLHPYPDVLHNLDRALRVGPEDHSEYRSCVWVPSGGLAASLDYGLILDDVELKQSPYDPDSSVAGQTVPNFDPGLFWWLDRKLYYDATLFGGVWVPNGAVLDELWVCRVVSVDDFPPQKSPFPPPEIMDIGE